MQLNLKQLPAHLKSKLLPIYLITGDILLLRQEAKDALRHAARSAGYTHYQRFDVEGHFDWSALTHAANHYSLFDEKIFIEFYNPDGKFDAEAGKVLSTYCENPPEEKILLINCPKLSGSQQKTRWFKSIQDKGAVLTIWPIKNHELPAWLNERLHQANFNVEKEALLYLAESTEGNLLASQQAITKLQLLFPEKKTINLHEMSMAVNDNAQFDIFELSRYCLQSNARGILRALYHLSVETEPTLVLWLLARECRSLLTMSYQLQAGQSLAQVLNSQWEIHKPLYQMALQRLTLKKLESILKKCCQADQIIKGVLPGDSWQTLTNISLELAGAL